jgi:hypothetical protein
VRLMPTLILSIACATAGCASKPGSYCLLTDPIRVAEQDLTCMTDETARAILRHNELWSALCSD